MRACSVLLVLAAAFVTSSNAITTGADQTSLSKLTPPSAIETAPIHSKRFLRKRVTAVDDEDEERAADIELLKSLPRLFKQVEGKTVHQFAHHLQGLQYTVKQREAIVQLYAAHIAKLTSAATRQ